MRLSDSGMVFPPGADREINYSSRKERADYPEQGGAHWMANLRPSKSREDCISLYQVAQMSSQYAIDNRK